MPLGTPVLAARDGVVVGIEDSNSEGGSEERFRDLANFVMIKHSDKTIGEYDHFKNKGVVVHVGQKVRVGDLIGYSSGPHLHFTVYRALSGENRESFPIACNTAEGAGIVLEQGKKYTNPAGIRFSVGAVKLEGYLGKKVHFGFNVKQDDWIQRIGLSSQTVKYDPIYWRQATFSIRIVCSSPKAMRRKSLPEYFM